MSAPTTRPPDRSANPPYGELAEANAAQSAAKAAGHGPSSQPKKVAPQQLTGAQSVIRSLEELDVDVIFGIPGGAVLPVYDPLFDSQKLRHVLVRHEQGAGHAASGYAHATGKVGVCMATSGPGATNLVTPLADAHMDSIPMVAITGQVGRALIGTDAFQEADISGITMPITKHNFLVRDGDDIPRVMAEAFHIASLRSSRCRCWSTSPRTCCRRSPRSAGRRRSSCPATGRTPSRTAGRSARPPSSSPAARKPVLYVGGGVIRGEASAELLELAELTGIPVVTTLMARGAFPDSHPQNLGMPGMHGTVAAVAALQRSDLLIALGTRFDDRVTGKLDSFAPDAKVIHADIDPAEIGKNRHADVPIVGDVKAVITELIEALRRDGTAAAPSRSDNWWEYLRGVQSTYPLSYGPQSDGSLSPEYVIETAGQDRRSGRRLRRRRRSAPDVGRAVHQVREPADVAELGRSRHHGLRGSRRDGRQVRAPGGRGVGHRRRRLLPDDQPGAGHLRGRGCADQGRDDQQRQPGHGAPVADAVLRRALQPNRSGHAHAIASPISSSWPRRWAASDCVVSVQKTSRTSINQARAINDRPVVIDFIVGADAQVWPMVAAGTSNDEIQAARGIRPLFDDDEGRRTPITRR